MDLATDFPPGSRGGLRGPESSGDPVYSTGGKTPQSQSHEQRGGEEAARSARHERAVDCSVGDHRGNASG